MKHTGFSLSRDLLKLLDQRVNSLCGLDPLKVSHPLAKFDSPRHCSIGATNIPVSTAILSLIKDVEFVSVNAHLLPSSLFSLKNMTSDFFSVNVLAH